MTSALHKRLQRLEELLAARTSGERSARRVIVQDADQSLRDGDELPTEAADELLILRVMVSPPERPADEALPEPAQAASPRIERGERTPLVIDRFRLPINYPNRGAV